MNEEYLIYWPQHVDEYYGWHDTAEPYVTVEVRNGAVTQAYGYQDSKPEKDALRFLAKWAKEKDLTLSWRWEKDFRIRRGR